MKKMVLLSLCFVFALGILVSGCASSKEGYLGNWKVEKKLDNAPLGDYGDGDLEKIIGSTLSFSKESASCFGDSMSTLGTTVSNPEYVSVDMDEETFKGMIGYSFADLGVSGSKITQISVVKDPDRNTGIVFYVIDGDTLLTNSVGTFFELSKTE